MSDDKPSSEPPLDRDLLLLMMQKIDGHGTVLEETRAEVRSHAALLAEMRVELNQTHARVYENGLMLEEMRSQNRATIEAVDARFDALRREMREGFARHDVRFDDLESIVRQHSTQFQLIRTDLRRVETKVDDLQGRVDTRGV